MCGQWEMLTFLKGRKPFFSKENMHDCGSLLEPDLQPLSQHQEIFYHKIVYVCAVQSDLYDMYVYKTYMHI